MKLLGKIILGFMLMASFSTALLADKDWEPCGDKKSSTSTTEALMVM